jgi:hypothetical protein
MRGKQAGNHRLKVGTRVRLFNRLNQCQQLPVEIPVSAGLVEANNLACGLVGKLDNESRNTGAGSRFHNMEFFDGDLGCEDGLNTWRGI